MAVLGKFAVQLAELTSGHHISLPSWSPGSNFGRLLCKSEEQNPHDHDSYAVAIVSPLPNYVGDDVKITSYSYISVAKIIGRF